MNVVNTGITYQIFGEDLSTYDKLPVKVYEVGFNKQQGFFLTSRSDFEIKEKIYGNCDKKVDKVLRGFETVSRNFGVILSGPKGVGKSLFAKVLASKAKEKGFPVILVSCYIPGISNFIRSIEQEVIVLFDEFEKIFSNEDDDSPQTEMLTLFDGIDNGKKLFVVTCNEVEKLSTYLINRPGRFHYHFILDALTPDEIREYLTDTLNPEYNSIIENVVKFSALGKITYDTLRAIAFELNQGYSLEETLEDLNISRDNGESFNITAKLDGYKAEIFNVRFPLAQTTPVEHWFSVNLSNNRQVSVRYGYIPADIEITKDAQLVIPGDKLTKIYVDEDDIADFDEPRRQEIRDRLSTVKEITVTPIKKVNSKYYLV